jgi:hypothetical protein
VLLVVVAFVTTLACRERYGLPLESPQTGFLVVEGNILVGDTTRINLSRTSPIAERRLAPERGASIQIEGSDNSIYQLAEQADTAGLYKSNTIVQNNNVQYRLTIRAGGKEYQTKWLDVIKTPQIDSVTWKRDEFDNGVTITAASSGNGGDSRYYKWDYDEVWEFHSKYESTAYFTYVLNPNGTKDYRCMDVTRDGVTYNSCLEPWYYPPTGRRNDSMYTCWKYQKSSNLNIGSTAAQTDNVLMRPVRKIPVNAWELSWLYSILVKQMGLSKDGYEFYRILEANSESLGTIFDAQPSELKTNLLCITNPSEKVIGFVDATNVQSRRLFISIRQLPDWRYYEYVSDCTDTLQKKYLTYEEQVEYNLVPTLTEVIRGGPPHMVMLKGLTYEFCADCRTRGVHRKPSFWP